MLNLEVGLTGFSCRALVGEQPNLQSREAGHFRPVSRVITNRQISPHGFCVAPILADIQPALSFTVLKDLAVFTRLMQFPDKWEWGSSDDLLTIVNPPSPLMFTGSLNIFLTGGMGPVVDRLFSLPSGIHFRKVALKCFRGKILCRQRGWWRGVLTLSNLSMLLVSFVRPFGMVSATITYFCS